MKNSSMGRKAPFKSSKKFEYSITYSFYDEESLEFGESFDSGYKVEPEVESISEILYTAWGKYGIYYPVSIGTWEATDVPEDRDFYEKGIRKYYFLHLKNEDGTEISEEDNDFVTHILSNGEYNRDYFEEFALGGFLSGSTNDGLSWKLDRAKFNKGESYEIPMSKRKAMGGDADERELIQLRINNLKSLVNVMSDDEEIAQMQGVIARLERERDAMKYAGGGGVGDDVFAYMVYNDDGGYDLVESPALGEVYNGQIIDIINENNQDKFVIKFENGKVSKLSKKVFDDYISFSKMSGGGDIWNYWKIEKNNETIYERTNVASPNIPNAKRISKEEYDYNVKKSYKTGGEVYFNGMSKKEILDATVVFDNNGDTLDRYTVFTPDGSVFGMSENASGFNQYIGEDDEVEQGEHLGRKLKSVPKNIQSAVLIRMIEEYKEGGGIDDKRNINLHDSVLYKGETWYFTEKNGVKGISNYSQGAWGTNFPFIPVSKINPSDVTDMMGRSVVFVFDEYAKGGKLIKSTLRANNSSLIKSANFKDGSHINLLRLNKPYKSGETHAVSDSSIESGQKVRIFQTLEDAELFFDITSDNKSKIVELREPVKRTQNYALGGVTESMKEEIFNKYGLKVSGRSLTTNNKSTADELAEKYHGYVEEDGSKYRVNFDVEFHYGTAYAKGGGVSEFWTEINESTLYERLPYDLGVVNEDEDLISGNIWIKFRKSPMEMPSYELKRAISEDFEYFGYGNQEPPKRVSLMDGSWGSFYIHVENLTLNEIMTLLLELPEQVQERLEERKIKGYKDLGLDTYGQSLDLRISQSSDDDDYEYADGGGVGELPSNLKKRLETANKILKKYNGRELTEKEAIRFNIDHNSQSGFQAGEEAFNLAGVNTLKNNPTTREYHTIGDALIDISRKMTGVEYDLKEYQIQEILKSKRNQFAKGGGVDEIEKITDHNFNNIAGFTKDPVYKKGNILVQRIGGSTMWSVAIDNKPKGRVLNAFTQEQAFKKVEKEKFADGGSMYDEGGEVSKAERIKEQYINNESNKRYTENALLLAETYGSKRDIQEAQGILKKEKESKGVLTKEWKKRLSELQFRLMEFIRQELNPNEFYFITPYSNETKSISGTAFYITSSSVKNSSYNMDDLMDFKWSSEIKFYDSIKSKSVLEFRFNINVENQWDIIPAIYNEMQEKGLMDKEERVAIIGFILDSNIFDSKLPYSEDNRYNEDDEDDYARGGGVGVKPVTYYVAYSSYFDSNKYDIEKMTKALESIGATDIHTENDRGWSNQPEVVVFKYAGDGTDYDPTKAIQKAFDTDWIIVRVKDWKSKKMKDGGEISIWELRKGDKVKTRKGNIETIERKIESGYFTKESEYSHSFESLEFVSRPKRKYNDGGEVEEWMNDALKELRDYTDNNSLKIEDVYDDDYFLASDGSEEYLVFEDFDEAHEYAVEDVKSNLESNAEYFQRDWLMGHLEAGNYLRNVYDEWNMGYATDIMTEDDDKYPNRLISEMVQWGIMDSDEAKGSDAEEIANDRMEDFVNALTDDQINQGNDGFDYYIDNFGEEEAFKMALENNLIDIEGASEDAVSVDGVAHFISSYDGEEIVLDGGSYAYRIN